MTVRFTRSSPSSSSTSSLRPEALPMRALVSRSRAPRPLAALHERVGRGLDGLVRKTATRSGPRNRDSLRDLARVPSSGTRQTRPRPTRSCSAARTSGSAGSETRARVGSASASATRRSCSTSSATNGWRTGTVHDDGGTGVPRGRIVAAPRPASLERWRGSARSSATDLSESAAGRGRSRVMLSSLVERGHETGQPSFS